MDESTEFFKRTELYKELQEEREEVLKHKWLESEKAGHDIGFESALADWIVKHRSKWIKYKAEQNKKQREALVDDLNKRGVTIEAYTDLESFRTGKPADRSTEFAKECSNIFGSYILSADQTFQRAENLSKPLGGGIFIGELYTKPHHYKVHLKDGRAFEIKPENQILKLYN